MEEEVKMVLDMAVESMNNSLVHLDDTLAHIRAGQASTRMIDGVTVDYYGSQVPLSQVSNISTPDSKTIAIQPWEKPMIVAIEKAIMNANLGFNPENNGELIRIFIPPLTEERRKDLSKQVSGEGEKAKVSIRNARKDANDQLKSLLKEGLSEDQERDALSTVQDMTNGNTKKIDDMIKVKNEEIFKI